MSEQPSTYRVPNLNAPSGEASVRLPGDMLIRLSEVETISGLKRSHIYKLIGENEFPRPVKIGTSSRWALGEVRSWIANKLTQRDAEKIPHCA